MTRSSASSGPPSLVLVTGHEGGESRDLLGLAVVVPAHVVVSTRRSLHHQVTSLLDATDAMVAVLPMTWGRDPVLVAESAKSLHWLATTVQPGRLLLCDAFGTPDHLVAHLRRAVRETSMSRPEAGVVVAAPAGNPFDDAELHRLAHLVRAHGAGTQVEVACTGEGGDAEETLRRCRLLGLQEVVVVPAGFDRWPESDAPGVTSYGPLLSAQAAGRVFAQRLSQARHRAEHGDDGIAQGLSADHGHGYAHSHDVGGAPAHAQHHPHAHAPGHPHPHPSAPVPAPR
ncbi:sirohydrochlorin chelatase [Nocardioides houyundeii]|uniref:sirohydrochlorin chelatase n=1 Tax=Nocardioides houyundeii TaxID=2045452 RepID=UPI001315A655|nr:cobalamin biosynthesis protein CbiX [Nocardioides houyundeii]